MTEQPADTPASPDPVPPSTPAASPAGSPAGTPDSAVGGADAAAGAADSGALEGEQALLAGIEELAADTAVELAEHEGLDYAQHGALRVRLARLELLLGMGKTGAGRASQYLPAWLRPTKGEHRWPVTVAVLVAIGLQLAIPNDLAFQPRWLLPCMEGLLFLALLVGNPRRINRETTLLRATGLALVTLISLAVAWSAALLCYRLATGRGGVGNDAVSLLLNGGGVWATNIIVFALWYWEFDRGGPAARANARKRHPDFLFAQMTAPELVDPDWEPGFIDYLYLSFTNATAFSPTDTLPLSRWAKLAMMFQSAVSLVTVALVVSRAVNILT